MAQTPFPVGFKQPRKGFQSSFNPQDFLNQYLRGLVGSDKGDSVSSPAPTGFKEIKPTTMMESETQPQQSVGATPSGIRAAFWASAPPGTLRVSQGSSPGGQPMTQGTFMGFIPSLDAYNALSLQAYKERTGEDFPGYDPSKLIYSTRASFDRGMPIDLNKSAEFFKSFQGLSDEEAANKALKLATRDLYIKNRPFAEQERQRRIAEGKAHADASRAGRWKSSLVG